MAVLESTYLKITIVGADKEEHELVLRHYEAALRKAGQEWVEHSRRYLAHQDKNASGDLSKSLEYYIDIDDDNSTIKLGLRGEGYGDFIEYGVQGAGPYTPPRNPTGKAIRPYINRAPKSPFKFGSGKGSGSIRDGIRKWLGNRRFQWRNDKGQFMSYDSMVFPITRNVWRYGIEPTPYLAHGLQVVAQKHKAAMLFAFTKDMANYMSSEEFTNKVEVEIVL